MVFGYPVNLLAVLVAAIVAFAVGGIWYGPLFGKRWMKLSGIKMGKGMKPMTAMGLYFFSMLFTSYILANIMNYFPTTVLRGFDVAFWIWIGFVAMNTLSSVFFENKSIKLYVLNNAYNLLSLLTMGGILNIWR